MNHTKNALFTLLTIAVIVFQLVSPALVHAQAETPLPTDTQVSPTAETPLPSPTAEETATPDEAVTPEAPTAVPEPATPDPVETETSTIETPTDVPATAAPPIESETPIPSETPAETATVIASDTPAETSTSVPTEAPSETPTGAPTDIATPSETPPGTPVETPVETVTPTVAPSETVTEVPTGAPTEISTPTTDVSETPPGTPIETPVETVTPTVAPSETITETPTAALTETPSSTVAPTETPIPVPTEKEKDEKPEDTSQLAAPPAETPAPPTESAETPVPEPALTEPPAETPPLLEVLASAPVESTVVIQNAEGQLEPLATKRGAEIIAHNGPMWCPGNSYSDECIPADTVSELVTKLKGKTGAGTVYFTETYNETDVIFNGDDPALSGLTGLTIQGGWNGKTDGNFALSGQTTFAGQVAVINWKSDVTVNNINATNEGAVVDTTGSVDVDQSNFSAGPDGVGLVVNAGKDVTVSNSEFSDSGTGLYVQAQGDVTVSNTFVHKNGTGVSIHTNKTSTLDNVAFCENTVTDVDPSGKQPDVVNPPANPCKEPPRVTPTPIPATIAVRVEGEFALDCAGQDGFLVTLPNDDMIQIFCPVTGTARITRMDNTMLPTDLPAGYSYVSAFSAEILQSNKPIRVIDTGGYITASFVATAEQPGARFGILFWDEEKKEWTLLKDYLVDETGGPQSFDLYPGDPDDIRKIISGVHFISTSDPTRSEVSVNFPGVFVLVQY